MKKLPMKAAMIVISCLPVPFKRPALVLGTGLFRPSLAIAYTGESPL